MRPLPKDAIVGLNWPMSAPVPVVAPPPKAERANVEAPDGYGSMIVLPLAGESVLMGEGEAA